MTMAIAAVAGVSFDSFSQIITFSLSDEHHLMRGLWGTVIYL